MVAVFVKAAVDPGTCLPTSGTPSRDDVQLDRRNTFQVGKNIQFY